MMNFPTATTVRKRLPKEAFYRHLALTNALKEKFVSDVDRIMVENSFTKQTLNLTASAETKEILLLSVRLKKQEFDGKVTEAIAGRTSTGSSSCCALRAGGSWRSITASSTARHGWRRRMSI